MIKKLLALIFALFSCVHAQQDDDSALFDFAFQELIYDIGVNLAQQQKIIDDVSAKDALMNVYEQVDQVAQIVDLFMMIDDEIVELGISSIEELIDFELDHNENMAQACIAWLAAYQKVFNIFIQIHGPNGSFVDWCYDIVIISAVDEVQELQDPLYEQLWHAGYEALQAQREFEDSLKALE